jgi:very-short-patch-repair endonuclease
VICSSDNARTLCAVELDDWRHDSWDNVKDADAMKDRICKAAGLPLIRIKVEENSDVAKLSQALREAI